MGELETIMHASGEAPNNCSCATCQEMCRRGSCMGTPSDMLKIIQAGHKDRLSWGVNLAGWRLGYMHPPVAVVSVDYDEEKGACVFFENGLCKLHDQGLKPTEGRLASCQDQQKYFQDSSLWFTIRAWLMPENEKVINEILRAMPVK